MSKKKSNYTIYIILGIILLIGLFSLLYFKVIKGNSSDSKSQQSEQDLTPEIIPTTSFAPTTSFRPSPTPSFSPSPTPTTSFRPSPTPSFSPYPTPTTSFRPSPTPSFSPYPTPTTSFRPSPTPTTSFSPSPTPTTSFRPSPTPTSPSPIETYTKPQVIDMIRDYMIETYRDIMPADEFSTNFRILAACDIEYLLNDIPGGIEEEKLYYIVQTIKDQTIEVNNLPCYEKQLAAYFEIMRRNGYEKTIESKVTNFVKKNIKQELFTCNPSVEGNINNAAEDCEYSAKERLAINTFKA